MSQKLFAKFIAKICHKKTLLVRTKGQESAIAEKSKRKMRVQPDQRCENVPVWEAGYLGLVTRDTRPEKLLVAAMLQGGSARNAREERQNTIL